MPVDALLNRRVLPLTMAPPDPQYMKVITIHPELETIFLNMHSAGLGVTACEPERGRPAGALFPQAIPLPLSPVFSASAWIGCSG